MIRFFKKSRLLFAALMLAATTASVAPSTAQASGGATSCYGGSGQCGQIYVVNVYYAQHGQWCLYGRYFATKYSNGSIDWGGADGAARQIRASGCQFTYTSSFWRNTNNG